MKKYMKQFVLVGGVLALFVGGTAFAAIDDTSHYWGFEEGTGRSVGDTGGQNGVLTGSSTGFGWASGKVGTALVMDGLAGEGVVLPNGFLSGTQGSLSVWIDMMDLTDRNIIFSGRSTTDLNIYASFSVDREGRPMFQFRDSTNGNDRKAQGSRIISKNEWVNVVFTANAQTYKMFVNGEEATVAGDNIGRWIPDLTNHTFMYRIGTLDASPFSGSFNGYIDDLRIYDRALSQDDVTALYNKGNDAKPSVPAKIAMTISSDTVPFGGSVSVNWTTEKVDTCAASGNWSGDVATSGVKVFVKLSTDATYKLSCSGKGGITEASVHVALTGTSTTVTTTGGSLTVTDLSGTIKPATTVSPERKAMIDKLIAQIMQLIVELQKQLAVLKAGGAR